MLPVITGDHLYYLDRFAFDDDLPSGLSLETKPRRLLSERTLNTSRSGRRFRVATPQPRCSRGHLRDEANTYRSPDGHQRCRECERIRDRARDRRPGDPTRLARSDAFPEEHFGEGHYRDEGCELAPSCLNCPLAQCRYDLEGGLKEAVHHVKAAKVIAYRAEGLTVEACATLVGISKRQAYRFLAEARA
jgi:hypothetical protein